MSRPFKLKTITHEPVVETFWYLEMPMNFYITGFIGQSFKIGDYLIVESDGQVCGKKKDEIEND